MFRNEMVGWILVVVVFRAAFCKKILQKPGFSVFRFRFIPAFASLISERLRRTYNPCRIADVLIFLGKMRFVAEKRQRWERQPKAVPERSGGMTVGEPRT